MSLIRKILFVESVPKDVRLIFVQQELRKVKDLLEASRYKVRFELEYEPAVTESEIQKSLLAKSPHILHFSGHGEVEGIYVNNAIGLKELLPVARLAAYVRETRTLECVVLCACHTQAMAQELSMAAHYVIGMNKPISDKAAGGFAEAFYMSVFENNSYEQAFLNGLARLAGTEEADTPEIWRKGVKLDPNDLRAANSQGHIEQKLLRSLARFDYTAQKSNFRKTFSQKQLHAYLIHGPMRQGHDWLCWNILLDSDALRHSFRYSFQFASKNIFSVEELFMELAKNFTNQLLFNDSANFVSDLKVLSGLIEGKMADRSLVVLIYNAAVLLENEDFCKPFLAAWESICGHLLAGQNPTQRLTLFLIEETRPLQAGIVETDPTKVDTHHRPFDLGSLDTYREDDFWEWLEQELDNDLDNPFHLVLEGKSTDTIRQKASTKSYWQQYSHLFLELNYHLETPANNYPCQLRPFTPANP